MKKPLKAACLASSGGIALFWRGTGEAVKKENGSMKPDSGIGGGGSVISAGAGDGGGGVKRIVVIMAKSGGGREAKKKAWKMKKGERRQAVCWRVRRDERKAEMKGQKEADYSAAEACENNPETEEMKKMSLSK